MSNIDDMNTKLWDLSNKYRGRINVDDFRNYFLSIFFYRYLSDNQHQYLSNNDLLKFYEVSNEKEIVEFLEDISSKLGYAINIEYTWDKIIDKLDEDTLTITFFKKIFESFNINIKNYSLYKDCFWDIFSNIMVGNEKKENLTIVKLELITDIFKLANEYQLTSDNYQEVFSKLIIGSAVLDKQLTPFVTPYEVSELISKLVSFDIKDSKQYQVYNPTMGSASLFLKIRNELKQKQQNSIVDFYGEEINYSNYNIARMNLIINDIDCQNLHLNNADVLLKDWPVETINHKEVPLKFDIVSFVPPFASAWDNKLNNKLNDPSKDPRFKFGVAPRSKADYAYVLHGLHHLKDTGSMAVVLSQGVLFRGAAEGIIRKNIIDNNLLDCVIGLPSNLFYGTAISACILIFKGKDARKDTSDILFIDASKEFIKERKQNKLNQDNINKIIDAYINRKDIKEFSHVASLEEIINNEYNLNIQRYININSEKESVNIEQISEELNKVSNIIENNKEELLKMLYKLPTNEKTEKIIKDLSEVFNSSKIKK